MFKFFIIIRNLSATTEIHGWLGGGSLRINVMVPLHLFTARKRSLAQGYIFTACNEVGQGYVLTDICHSVNRGELSASVHAGIPPPRSDTPRADTPCPPEQTPPHPPEQTPPIPQSRHPLSPRADTPQEQTPNPWSRRPWSRHPQNRHPPRADTPWSRHPPEQTSPNHRACWVIQSTHGQYASYWNAILLHLFVILFTGGCAWLLGVCVVAEGVCAWLLGGVCMVARRACMVARGACMVAGGGWWACMAAGGVCVVVGCVWLWRTCMVAGGHTWLGAGAMHGCGGHARLWGCMVAEGGVHRIQRDTVNEQAVRILLVCILVYL